MAIRDQYVEIKRSIKDEKPKPIKRKPKKTQKYETSDIVAGKPVQYITRG